MKKRILSLVLCAAMLLSMCLFLGAGVMDDTTADGSAESTESYIPAVNFTNVAPFVQANAQAANGPARAPLRASANAAATQAADNGVVTSKTAKANDDGTYTITLEAYATGSKVITEIQKDVPTDIVLVLDQSGSMDDPMGTVTYEPYSNWDSTNADNYNRRHNGGSANLWYKLNDGSYVSVSVSLQQEFSYSKIDKGRNDNGRGGYTNYWDNRENLYTYVNGELKKVIYTRTRDYPWENWTCTYALEDGTILNQNNDGSKHSPVFQHTDDGYLYLRVANDAENVYTYTYTDSTGAVQTIDTSTGANETYAKFYERSVNSNGGGKRLDALKTAATEFAESVAAKAAGEDGELGTDDDIDHRIAVVGFASESGYGNNSELLSISGSNSGSVGVAYNDIKEQNLKDVLQSMKTAAGQTMVTSAINALAANGATRTDLGMDMAKRILSANPVPAGQERNRVVVVFTDGSPTDDNGFQLNIADSAITTANDIKAANATVYSIGIFSGADATSSGERPSDDYYDYYGGGGNYTAQQMTNACNWFMQNLSSNNGAVKNPSYYLSAADAKSLKNIFKQISDQIESGGSSSTLTGEAVVKDVISPQFTLPTGTTVSDITLETYACTGKNGSDYTWRKNADAMGAMASISGDQVSVTGFNFSDNYVGTVTENGNTSYRGNKLVISFKVEPKAGFLGGNNVYTNDSAGVYVDSAAETPLLTFDRPTVNVPIKKVSVTAADKNVYLLGDLTAAELKNGATVKVGDVPLDLTNDNYGLKPWQTAYVNIEVTITDKDGNVVTTDGFSGLKEDTTYTVTVKVSPNETETETSSGAAATEQTGRSSKANVNVYKPVLTYKDSEVYYGEAVPTSYTSNFESTVWKHGDTEAPTSMGTAPTLTMIYTPEAAKIDGGKINTRQDVGVDVTVKIDETDVTDKASFVHTNCEETTCKVPDGCEFVLHVKTCSLTISKTVTGKGADPNQTFVFNVMKDGKAVTTVVLKGNTSTTITGLAVGDYTVVEDTNWSWSYTIHEGDQNKKVRLDKDNGYDCEAKITNTAKENHWLTSIVDVINKWTSSTTIEKTNVPNK